jgi:tetratricopeptide (TPR) repeat protein
MRGVPARANTDSWILIAICGALVALIWAVFGQVVGFGFINYDDPIYVLQNVNIRGGVTWHGIKWAFTHIHSENWHPLTSISHMLDCQLFGVNAGGHHLVNVLLHTIATLVLFFALRSMTGPSRAGCVWRSGFVAALFAIHPLRVESVAWISERKDVLSGVFFMLTLLAYARYARKPSWLGYAFVLVCFAFGLMAKPMLITLPVILLLLDYWPLRRFPEPSSRQTWRTFRRLFLEKIPLFVLSVASCIATLVVQDLAIGSTEHLPLQWRLTNALVSYVEYLRQMIWPTNLMPFYVHPENRLPGWEIALALMVLITISAIAVRLRRKHPYLLVGWAWYVIMLLPVIGIIQVGLQGHADRYTYLPQIGIYLAIAWTIGDLSERWRARSFVVSSSAAVVIIALATLSWKQTSYWRGTESLWTHALEVEPDSDVAHTGLGGILLARGRVSEAISHYERALQLRSGNAGAHHGLAVALAGQNRTEEAIDHWKKSLEILPDNIEALNRLAVALATTARTREAMAEWEKVLAYEPNDANAANNLAWVLATSPEAEIRNGPRAVQLAERAVQLTQSKDPTRLRTLAAAYAENGEFLAAVPTATKALELAEAQGNKALADHLRYCADLFFRKIPLRDKPQPR